MKILYLTIESELNDVEILGNTFQDSNHLEIIKSVGNPIENSNNYEIVVSSRNELGNSTDTSTFQLPCKLESVGDTRDRFYYDNMYKQWIIEKKVKWENNVGIVLTEPKIIKTNITNRTLLSLSTYSGKTIIAFNTEIEPILKCRIPKSLGAVVDNNNKQINYLKDEIDNIKGLINTSATMNMNFNSDLLSFKTIDGYINNMVIKGNTQLVNNELKSVGQNGIIEFKSFNENQEDKRNLLRPIIVGDVTTYEPIILRSINQDVYDSIENNKFIQRCRERDYQVGDENNSNVLTDKVKTIYELDLPLEIELTYDLNLRTYANETNLIISNTEIYPYITFDVINCLPNTVKGIMNKIDKHEQEIFKLYNIGLLAEADVFNMFNEENNKE